MQDFVFQAGGRGDRCCYAPVNLQTVVLSANNLGLAPLRRLNPLGKPDAVLEWMRTQCALGGVIVPNALDSPLVL